MQAEFESASLSHDSAHVDKRTRAAALFEAGMTLTPTPKATNPKAPGLEEPTGAQAKALSGASEGKGKGKGKEKGKDGGRELGLCHAFTDKKGCKFGDSCKFKHDRAAARKQGRCLACGQEGHYRPECPNVKQEWRHALEPGSPSSQGSPTRSVPPPPKCPPTPKPKVAPQAKALVEDERVEASSVTGVQDQEEMAEAAKILKGVSLKPLRLAGEVVGGLELDRGWLMRAVARASDPQYALVDSGATNALRPARDEELKEPRVIKVDLASGVTELHINKRGTLLSSVPCQVIIPAGYFVQLGFSIAWKKKLPY